MKNETSNSPLRLLTGGGEMGALTRSKDWSQTSVGDPATWPQSLRTTLSIILNSKFPMFLWWGTDLICFYNDAYRPSLGHDGKHPAILGQPAKEAWPEIWDIIKPLIDQVLAGGEATWHEDQLIPIFRNGKIEDVYWTFSYSPVNDESGLPAGVLVTCMETTDKVQTLKAIEEREEQLSFTLNAAELGTWDLNPATNHFAGNDRLKEWFGIPPQEEIDLALALNAIVPEDRQMVAEKIATALNPASGGDYEAEYTIRNPETGREKIVVAKGKAIFRSDGSASRFSGILQDNTEREKIRKKIAESEKKFRNTVQQAPVGITILHGPEFVVLMANDTYLNVVDRTEQEFVGRPLFEAMPEVEVSVSKLLTGVLKTGISYHGTDFPVTLKRFGNEEISWFNFVYHPLTEDNGEITGIIVVATEVTASVKARHALAEKEKQFRNLIMQSPIAMTIFRGRDFVIEVANDVMFEKIWRRKQSDVLGKKLLDVFPELKLQKYPDLLTAVYETGAIYRDKESIAFVQGDDELKKFYFDFEYNPLVEVDGTTSGIMVTVSDVTEKVEARQKVEESEKRFRNVADSAPVLIWMAGTDKLCNFYNKAWLEFTGRTMEPDMATGWADSIHKDDLARCNDVFTTAFDKREEFNTEYRLRRHDGEYRWVSDNGVPRYKSDGTFEGYIGASMDIHERIVYQKQLKENEERLSIIIAASGLGNFEWSFKTDNIIVSDRYLEIFGYDKNQALNHARLLDHLHPDDRPIRDAALAQAFETGILNYEARIIWNDGSAHWMEAKGKVFYDELQKPLKLIGTVRDITDLKNHQQELLEREQKFRLLADSMPQFVWTGDAEGNLNYFNKSVYDYSGLTPGQVRDNGWLDIVHPDDREENARQWMQSVASGDNFLFEHRFRRHDGIYRWQLSRAVPQKDTQGRVQMWVGSSTDIEEQKLFAIRLEEQVREQTSKLKQSHEELIKSEERYHLMVGEVQDYAILFINQEGIIENWNKGAEKIKGYTADEAIGKNFSIFYTQEDREKNLPDKMLAEALAKGRTAHEGIRVRKNGNLFWASVVITPLRNADNKVIGFSKVTRDLTEKRSSEDRIKKYAAELEQKNKDLEKMNVELQSFAYVSSHDLQEPLRKIQTFSSRILEKENQHLSDKGKDYFKRMQEAARRMQTLIEDLLAYSRASTSERIFISTDLQEIINEVTDEMKETILESGAIIESGNMCRANIIPFQFRQLMQNLIGNALKFSRPGMPPLIKISSRLVAASELDIKFPTAETTYCHITVADNGIGFDMQYRDRIFEVFQRLHGKDEYKGTGIGLAIVKKILENHNGVIEASGTINGGATFDIYIPATEQAQMA